MAIDRIIGRKEECYRLERCLQEKQAQLVLVYGRRRVGKTYLINRFFDDGFDYKLTGEYKATRETQLKNFESELIHHWDEQHKSPADWQEAFDLLRTYLETLPNDKKRIVFFDEMPWMDSQRSGFLQSFEWFWNHWGSAQQNLIFLICGSATSWITEKIVKNKGGLFNRLTAKIYLKPFDLHTTEMFLQEKNITWARYDILECYMIMGGIPYYLNLLDDRKGLHDNIDALFFNKQAELWNEFDMLYHTLFSNSEKYIKIVRVLNKKRSGKTRTEIANESGISLNGALTKMLENLVDSGFVREYSKYNKKGETLYQLSDYYTMFYLRFIDGKPGKDEKHWMHTVDDASRRVWAGLTFEQVCKDHINQIKKALGISGVYSEVSVWEYRPSPDSQDERGAQIDLLIDRRDRVVNLCEIKHSSDEFRIDKDYDLELRNKIGTFVRTTRCKKTVALTMITTYGVAMGKYKNIVNSEITMDDLFE